MPVATPRLPGARGRLNLALDWGLPALLDCIGTGGGARGSVASNSALAARLEGRRDTLSAAVPPDLPVLFTRVALLLST